MYIIDKCVYFAWCFSKLFHSFRIIYVILFFLNRSREAKHRYHSLGQSGSILDSPPPRDYKNRKPSKQSQSPTEDGWTSTKEKIYQFEQVTESRRN